MSNKKVRKLRTLWNSNGINVPSGYGVFQRDLLYRLKKDGWPIAQSAFVGVEGAVTEINGLTVYPKMNDPFGSDGLAFHSKHFNADVSFSMQDVWTLDSNMLMQVKKWIPYVPIDQEPIPQGVLDKLRYAYRIITFSRWGQKALEKAGFTSTLILEGTDTNIFKPMDKIKCRQELGLPQDKFIFGQIGANKENPGRKGWQESLEAFKMFHDVHPDSIYFYQTNQFSPGGFPLEQFAHQLGLDNAIFKVDPYLGTFHTGSPEIAKMLNAVDVLLHPSTTEGFGLVSVEAQACGVPVIVNRCTSMPEMVVEGESGEVCESNRKFFSSAGGYWYLPDPVSLYEKMEKLFSSDRITVGKAGRMNVLENYDIDKLVKEKWIPLYEELQKEIYPDVLK
jgi:glycosyltransferase involved in cell wall biosynthesis